MITVVIKKTCHLSLTIDELVKVILILKRTDIFRYTNTNNNVDLISFGFLK